MIPPLPQEVIAAAMAGESSNCVFPKLAGVHVARFVTTTLSTSSANAEIVQVDKSRRGNANESIMAVLVYT